MPEDQDPREAPFTELRLPAVPLAPRPAFAADLRTRIEQALVERRLVDHTPADRTGTADRSAPTDRTDRTHEEAPMSTTTDPDAAGVRSASPLSPYLAVAGAAQAIDWYRDVLGAIETTRFVGDDGRIGHAEVVVGGARIMLADEFPEIGVHGPGHYGGTSVLLHLEVADVDWTYERAVAAGAQAARPPADQGHGNRNATIIDPFGHRWMLSQPIDASRAEVAGAERGAGGDGNDWEVRGGAPVEPGYLTIHTADRDRAAAFYGALFGWEVGGGSQGGHVRNTRFPLGLAGDASAGSGAAAGTGATAARGTGGPGSDVGPRTTVYFRVDDLDHYARRVEELGGRVEDRVAYDAGASVRCVDDQGYRFELWVPAPGY